MQACVTVSLIFEGLGFRALTVNSLADEAVDDVHNPRGQEAQVAAQEEHRVQNLQSLAWRFS